MGRLKEVPEQVRVGCQAYIVYLVDKESLAPFMLLLCEIDVISSIPVVTRSSGLATRVTLRISARHDIPISASSRPQTFPSLASRAHLQTFLGTFRAPSSLKHHYDGFVAVLTVYYNHDFT